MPKARNSKVDEALALYQQGLKLIEIARKLDIPEGTVRRWKCTYKWDSERSQPEKPNARKRGGLPGNRNRAAPKGNKRAEKFGFYSKYLPEETLEIFGEIQDADPLDLLWDQIRFSYTRPSSGLRRSPMSRTPKTRPSRRSRTAAALSPGARSGKCSRPGTSRPTL